MLPVCLGLFSALSKTTLASPYLERHVQTIMFAMQVGTPGGSYTYGLTPAAAAVQAAAMAPAPMATPFAASAGRRL